MFKSLLPVLNPFGFPTSGKSSGIPNKNDLLGAWLHKKAPQETTILDERPNVDYSRTWYKARALQFTGTEYIDVPYQLDLTQKYKFTYEFICTEYNGWEPIIDSRVQSSDKSFNNYIRPDRTVSINSQYGQLNFDPLITDCRYLVTIEHNGSEITATFDNTTLGTSQTLSNNTLANTPDTAETFFRIGGAPYGTGGLRQRLGYFKYERDGITLIEYAFEEGEGIICYNRVMNNFHGTINNATISTFRVEDVRITNGDQGTFLNTEGYRDNNKIYSSTDYVWQTSAGCTIEQDLSFKGKEGVKKITFPAGTYSNAILQAFHNNALLNLTTTTNANDHILTYYFPSGQQNNWFSLPSTATRFQAVEDTWATVSFNIGTPDVRVFMIDGDGDSNLDITITEDVVIYIGDYVVTEPNVYVPRPRVTDIPLYNAGKYGYYIPDDANNSIDLNTAFAGLTNDGDWMEFGIATVGTGKPTGQLSWGVSIDGSDSSSFYLAIDNADVRFYSSSGRVQVTDANIVNEDFYSFRITKDENVTSTVVGIGTIEVFDRDGNLITSYPLTSGPSGNEGTYIYDRFFPSVYGTDFILAYLKLSDGTVWNGANDFNGGVSITNSGTGNVTKIFFESVNEDVLGNPLTYNKPVAINLQLVNSNCAFYHQSGCDLTFSGFIVQDFTMVLYADLDSALQAYTGFRALYGSSSSDIYYMQSDEIYFRANGQTTNSTPWIGGPFSNEDFTGWKVFIITRDFASGTITLHVNGVSKSVLETVSKGFDYRVASIGDSNNQYLAGKVAYSACYNRVLTQEEIDNWNPYNAPQTGLEVFHIHNAGTGAVVYDVSGNNRHANVNGAILSTFWGSKQNVFHWNLIKGFTLSQNLNPVGYTITGIGGHQVIREFSNDSPFNKGRSILFTIGTKGEGYRFNTYISVDKTYVNFWLKGLPNTVGKTVILDAADSNNSAVVLTQDWVLHKRSRVTSSIAFADISFPGSSTNTEFEVGNQFLVVVQILTEEQYLDYYIPEAGTSTPIMCPEIYNNGNPAGKWHNDAETEINFPHTAQLQVINELFDYKPFFYKNAQLNDGTAVYSVRKVIADYEGPLLNVIRSSDLQAQDFYPDNKGDLDTAAITKFVNESTPVLDNYSGAASAYALHKVRPAYTGSAINVRRSSDGGTKDIGFDANGELDTTALLDFVNADVEKIVNGDFATDTNWTKGTGWTISGGAANCDGTQTSSSEFKTAVGIAIQGVEVTFSFEVKNYSAGTLNATIEGTGSLEFSGINANGVYSTTATSSDALPRVVFTASSDFVGSIDDVSVIQSTVDGHVVTWYDQSQNDPLNQNNATQATPASQPKIINAGALLTENGKPAIKFDGVDDYFIFTTPTTLSGGFFITAVLNSNPSATFELFLQNQTSTNDRLRLYATGDIQLRISGSAYTYFSAYTPNTQELLTIERNNANTLEVYVDGTSKGSTVDVTADWTGILGYLGSNQIQSSGQFYTGTFQELIVFNSDQSGNRIDIEGNIGRYYSIDGFADGRVATWYDQANANHGTQATPDSQPLIVNNGVLVTENGKPAIEFDGVDDYYEISGVMGGAVNGMMISVHKTNDGTITFDSCQIADSSPVAIPIVGSNQVSMAHLTGTRVIASTANNYYNRQLLVVRENNNGDHKLHIDGATVITSTNAISYTDVLKIGRVKNGAAYSYFNNKLQEIVLYNSDQSSNRQDIEKNIADYYNITLSGNAGVESWVKNVSFADMYRIWYDYEYLHRLFANFEIPNKVFKILAYTSELTADQRQKVYNYLQKNYHPIYTPYSTRVLADSGILAAGQTNTLTIIDSI